MLHGRLSSTLAAVAAAAALLTAPCRAVLAQAAAPSAAAAPQSEWIPCAKLWSWLEYQCTGAKDSWTNGTPVLYLTGITYHDRGTYTAEKLAEFNEDSWGGGFGWGHFNAQGDYFGWYGLVFRDSHFKYTKMFGWNWMTYWPQQSDFALGIGYTAFLGSRPDIYSSVPFPGILPLLSVKLAKAEVFGTYIPKVSAGTTGNGNVAFIFGRWLF